MAQHTGAETAAAEQASGMPQLDFSTWPNQIFWLAVTLLAIHYILTKIALPRIAETIGTRQETIANDLEQASALRQKAEDAEAAYNRALAEARSEAQRIAAEARAEIQKEVDTATDKANAEIAAKTAESERRIEEIRASALENVEAVATDTAGAVVEAILPGAGDEGAVRAAVGAAMKG